MKWRLGLWAAMFAAACTATPPHVNMASPAAPAADDVDAFASSPPEAFDFRFSARPVQGGLVIGQAPTGTRHVTLDGKPVKLAPNGKFMLGFGRDAKESWLLEATGIGGRRFQAEVPVGSRAWQIQRLPSLRVKPSDNPEYEALRSRELARIRAARARQLDSLDWLQPFVWPVTGRISGVFGSQRILGGVPANPHAGVDIARPTGTSVRAPQGGTVTLASPPAFSLEGNMVFIDHGYGLSSAFLHLSRVDVREGERVEQGDVIGAIGSTGRATGPHLHWAMVWNGVRVDPQLLVPPMPAVSPASPVVR